MEEKQMGNVPVSGMASSGAVKDKAEKKAWQNWYFWVILVLVLGVLVEAGGIAYLLMRKEDSSGVVESGREDSVGESKDEGEGSKPEDDEKPGDTEGGDLPEGGSSGNENQEDTAQYIYIGEWGKKFKIPEGLTRVSYKFKRYSNYEESLCVTGMPKDATGNPEFATYLDPGLGCLSRISQEAKGKDGYEYLDEWGVEFDSDGYIYHFSGMQSALSTDKQELEWEVQAVNMVREMLSLSDSSDF